MDAENNIQVQPRNGNSRAYMAAIIVAVALVLFAAIVVVAVQRSVGLSDVESQLKAANEEISELRASNRELEDRVRELIVASTDTRRLILDLLQRLDPQDRQDIQERLEQEQNDRDNARAGSLAPSPQPDNPVQATPAPSPGPGPSPSPSPSPSPNPLPVPLPPLPIPDDVLPVPFLRAMYCTY